MIAIETTAGSAVRPRLNPDFEPLRLRDGSLLLLQRSGAPVLIPAPPPMLGQVLERADGSRSMVEILATLGVAINTPEASTLQAAVDALGHQGIVSEAVRRPEWFDGELAARFASYVDYLDRFASDHASAYDYFRRMRDGHVVVIGLGGAGSVAAVMLAAAGVGRLTLVDGDHVEVSNLVRQPFFAERAEGQLKTEALAAYLTSFSSFTALATIPRYIGSLDDAREVVQGADFVCLCADAPRFLLNRWVNEACMESAVPYLNGFHRRIGPMCIPGKTPCFECYETFIRARVSYHDMVVEAMQRPPHRRAPSSFLGAVLTGMVQANECIGYLSGAWTARTETRCAHLNEVGVVSFQAFEREPACRLCGTSPPPEEEPATANPALVSWDDFVADAWQRRPVILPSPTPRPLISESAALAILCHAFERQRAGQQVELRVYLGARQCTPLEAAAYAPSATDESCQAYASRVHALAGAESLTVVLNRAHAHAPALWERSRDFLSGLYAHTGVPTRVEAVLYLSTSSTTVFGVHADPYENFLLPLAGVKTFRVWAGQTADAPALELREQSGDYEELVVARPDALYLPADRPHLGLSDGAAALHLSLAIDRRGRGLTDVFTREIVEACSEGRTAGSDFLAGPSVAEDVAASCTDLVANLGGELAARLAGAALRVSSAGGFREVPPLRDAETLQDSQWIVVADPRWLKTAEVSEALVCSANGHAFSLPAHPDVIRMLARLGTGAPVRLGALLDAYASDAAAGAEEDEVDREALREVVSLLHRMRAVERAASGACPPGGHP
jgi:molybdopterin-synthase adenylyltransferase